jgi:hypothetical protein
MRDTAAVIETADTREALSMVLLGMAWVYGVIFRANFPGARTKSFPRARMALRFALAVLRKAAAWLTAVPPAAAAGPRPDGRHRLAQPRFDSLPLAGTVPAWRQCRPVRVPGCPWDGLTSDRTALWYELIQAGDTGSFPALADECEHGILVTA